MTVIVRYVLGQQRYEQIVARLRAEGPTQVAVLADLLHVSQATIRRDLGRLAADGVVLRVHGGATLPSAPEPPFAQVETSHAAGKDLVADAAARMVADGDVVLLDIGTTTHRIAARLRGRSITVITSSLAVCGELGTDGAIELILLGGVVRRNYQSLVGFLTAQALAQVRADKLFLGTSGVRNDGTVLDTTVVEVPVKQAMLQASDQVILVADGSKFPGSGLARICGAGEIDTLVTSPGADPTTLATFEEAGAEVWLESQAQPEPEVEER